MTQPQRMLNLLSRPLRLVQFILSTLFELWVFRCLLPRLDVPLPNKPDSFSQENPVLIALNTSKVGLSTSMLQDGLGMLSRTLSGASSGNMPKD